MPKMKNPKKKREEEEDEETLISTPSLELICKEDGEDFHGVSHTKAKRKKQQNKKNGDNSSNEASQLNRKMRKEEAEKDDKKKEKLKEKKKEEKEDEEEDASELPGQKHKRPHERDPLRIFFETLYQQLPDNELVAMWMMEWGLLTPEEAKKVYQRQLEKDEHQDSAEDAHPKEKLKVPSSKEDEISELMIMKTKKRKNIDNRENGSILSKKKKQTQQKFSSG